jgi:hypothetical protein
LLRFQRFSRQDCSVSREEVMKTSVRCSYTLIKSWHAYFPFPPYHLATKLGLPQLIIDAVVLVAEPQREGGAGLHPGAGVTAKGVQSITNRRARLVFHPLVQRHYAPGRGLADALREILGARLAGEERGDALDKPAHLVLCAYVVAAV